MKTLLEELKEEKVYSAHWWKAAKKILAEQSVDVGHDIVSVARRNARAMFFSKPKDNFASTAEIIKFFQNLKNEGKVNPHIEFEVKQDKQGFAAATQTYEKSDVMAHGSQLAYSERRRDEF